MNRKEFYVVIGIVVILLILNFLTLNAAYTTIFSFLGLISPVEPWWKLTTSIFSIIMATLVVFTAVVIILERRDPARTLAWLLVLIFLPILGFILYLSLGRQFHKRRMTKKKRALNESIYPLNELPDQPVDLQGIAHSKERLVQLISNNADFPITLHNKAVVLTDGEEIFPAFLDAIKNAREHIHLETYILREDEIGQKFAGALSRKAKEGVEVRIIYDGLGSRALSKKYIEELRSAGIEIEPFFPVKLPLFHSKINYRNHRKILVVDGKIGFVGGINIGDEYLGKDPQIGFWRDTHLQLEGNAVYFLQRIFLQDWYFITGKTLEKEYCDLFPVKEPPGNKLVQITASGPDTHWEAIMQVYYYAIATAQKSVHLTSPYFVPNESLLTALKTAALSGVDVKLLLPAKPDHKIVFWAAMSYMEELMEAGVEFYLYKKGFIHSKVVTIDGLVSVIGSANMDQRSFQLNFEVNALVYDREITKRLEDDFFNDLQCSELLNPESFKERPLNQKILESGARLLSPLL